MQSGLSTRRHPWLLEMMPADFNSDCQLFAIVSVQFCFLYLFRQPLEMLADTTFAKVLLQRFDLQGTGRVGLRRDGMQTAINKGPLISVCSQKCRLQAAVAARSRGFPPAPHLRTSRTQRAARLTPVHPSQVQFGKRTKAGPPRAPQHPARHLTHLRSHRGQETFHGGSLLLIPARPAPRRQPRAPASRIP
ncbi:hypothetical protein NDU88_004809 [Pleurodeles waltl]|uniref:Uncharacterized protein n=1 Tax=Pleurodeles waltl TaxID=8319 RepID=A0AAV7SJV6_PLEWA|nr:hypothetical protein NDU88_004809 [Pleurodeles waltl]